MVFCTNRHLIENTNALDDVEVSGAKVSGIKSG